MNKKLFDKATKLKDEIDELDNSILSIYHQLNLLPSQEDDDIFSFYVPADIRQKFLNNLRDQLIARRDKAEKEFNKIMSTS